MAPGTIDEINASVDQTNRAINQIQVSGQDQLAKIGQLPTASTLGNVFGSLGTAAANAVAGNNAYTIGGAAGGGFGIGSGGVGVGPSAPGIG